VSQAIQRDPVTRSSPHIAPRHNRPSSRCRGPDQATCRTESRFQAAGGYTNQTQNVAALKRARDQDLAVHPVQDIEYVVVDDERSSRGRVVLVHEAIDIYDASYYETQLVRAVESILAPLDLDRNDIRREFNGTHVVGITDWT
jgi:DNA polymerase elongation subunit (family B)